MIFGSRRKVFILKTGGTQALSTQILLSIIAPWYADFDDSADEVGDSISIVLIDDQFIAERNGVYPLPYEEQSQLIQRITFRRTEHDQEIKPTAVFVDLIYADDRGVRERAKQEQVWREAFRNIDAEQPPLPQQLVSDSIATLGGFRIRSATGHAIRCC
ncbi:MAG: hypothetical protein HWD60_09275 [Defluviicoccus sp.]|nr:MAG: hypothetical protein HWD60_09275 [Defluviicoccus sp.]